MKPEGSNGGDFNRREILKNIGALGAVAAGTLLFRELISEIEYAHLSEDERKTINHLEEVSQDIQAIEQELQHEAASIQDGLSNSEKHELLDTLRAQVLVYLAKLMTTQVFSKLGIPTGNQKYSPEDLVNLYRNFSLKDTLESCVAIPFAEEVLFRLWPSLKIGSESGVRLDIGALSSLLFALNHNVRVPKGIGNFPELSQQGIRDYLTQLTQVEFRTDSVPITQFMGGLFYWYLMRTKGFDQAVFAHMVNNSMYLGIAKLLDAVLPPDVADAVILQLEGRVRTDNHSNS